VSEDRAIPLIRLYDSLLVSVQTELSDARIERLIDDVTLTIERTEVAGLILDFSGADILDSHVTRRVRDLAVTARIMGVHTILCGLRRSTVIALVEMGLGTAGVETALSLERALERLALRRRPPPHDLAPRAAGSSAEEPRPAQEQGVFHGPEQ
jgi:rsbT antagonist protein RsbS